MNTQNTDKMTQSDIGCVIDGSADSADYINKETVELAQRYGFDADLPNEHDAEEDHSQILSELGDAAVNYLNDNIDGLPYCSFYFEDNSLFYTPSVEMAREDVEFISSKENEYPSDDFEGEWLHVNDHGNATLYVRQNGKDNEIWSVV